MVWERKGGDGKGRMEMGREGWRREGKDEDGKGRMKMEREGWRWEGQDGRFEDGMGRMED